MDEKDVLRSQRFASKYFLRGKKDFIKKKNQVQNRALHQSSPLYYNDLYVCITKYKR